MGEHAFVVDSVGQAGQLSAFHRRHEDLAAAFLVQYPNAKTREGHAASLRFWFAWCDRMGFDPLNSARHQIRLWLQQLELEGKGARTRNQRLTTLRLFYAFLVYEDLATTNPTDGIKRAPMPRISTTGFLRPGQMLDLVTAAKVLGPHAYGLICVLSFNGFRIGEACRLDVDDLEYHAAWPHLHVIRGKSGEHQRIEIDRVTELAVKDCIAGRSSGPMFLTAAGTRMNRAAAARILKRLQPAVRDCPPRLHPHMLRHSWTTAGIKAGVPRQRMIRDGGWVDGRMMDDVYGHIIDQPGGGAAHLIASTVLSG